MMIYVASVNGSTSAEKFHKGKSETNFPLTILIRMVGGFLQFVGAIHNYGWDMGQHSTFNLLQDQWKSDS